MVPRFPRRRPRRVLSGVAATLVVASVLTLVGAPPASATTPSPTVVLQVDDAPLIGSQVTMDLTFTNAASVAVGYGPYTDLFLPTTGADGTSAGGPNDGISFVGADYLGLSVTSQVVTLACSGADLHPLTGQTITCPAGFRAGDTMVVLTLPFGSFTPSQPAAVITVTTQLSNFADLGTALPVVTRGGFRYGADPLDNPIADPPILQAPATSRSITPRLVEISKESDAPEAETATGENFPRRWNVLVQVAPGQTLTDLTVTDQLGDNLAYAGVTGISPAGTVTDEPSGPGPWASESVAVTFPTVTGSASWDLEFWVPELDAAGDPILDPTTGAPASVTNTASAVGTWDPLDPRDATGVGNAVVDPGEPLDLVVARSVATQKSVQVTTDVGAAGPTPGDTLTWTIEVQVSDYFDLDGLDLDDLLSDGQTLDPGFDPLINYSTPLGSGSSTLGGFLVAETNGPASPGGCDPTEPGATTVQMDLSGFLADAVPASGGVWAGDAAGGTTASITYRTVIDADYRCRFGGGAVNTRDVIDNRARVSGTVDVPGGGVATDGTSAAVTIVAPTVAKSIYAIGGDATETGPQIAPGEVVTYRVRSTIPLTNSITTSVTDYLPLPTFDIPAGATPFSDLTGSGPVPAGPFTATAWSIALGPDDTFSDVTSSTPTISVDQTNNAVTLTYPDFQAASGTTAAVSDLLITVQANDDPFADGLFLTNQARLSTSNSPSVIATNDALVQVELTEPELDITKGVVATDRAGATFSPSATGPSGITWSSPGSTGTRFSGGSLTSAALATRSVDSNLSGVDAGDTVTFAIVVENTGSGVRGAFDVTVSDLLPADLVEPAGGWNLRVTDGNGDPLPTDVADLFAGGVRLTDPSANQGALSPASPTSGTNVAVITFDATLDADVAVDDALSNVAEVENYSGTEGGPTFVSGTLSDNATVAVADPSLTKTLTGTGTNGVPISPANVNVPIGAVAAYEVVVTVPEGETQNFNVRDTLDSGLAMVSLDSIAASPALSTSAAGGFAGVLSNAAIASVGMGGTAPGRQATFDFATLTNTDRDNSTAETITITYTVVVLNNGVNTNGGSRNNSVVARVGSTAVSSAVSAANVIINEPSLTVAKTASTASADAGDTVDFTVTVTASSAIRTITAHDVVLTDTLPAGLDYETGSFTHTAGVAPTSIDAASSTPTASWTTMAPGATSTFTLSAIVRDDATSFGATATNTAAVTYTSLAGPQGSSLSPYNTLGVQRTGSTTDTGGTANTYRRTGSASVTVNATTITKSLTGSSATHTTGDDLTIGEVGTYSIQVSLPEGDLGDITVTDLLPTGLVYVDGSASIDATDFAGSWDGFPALPTAQSAGGNVSFTFDDVTVDSGPGTSDNTLDLTLSARVADVPTNSSGTRLENTARVTIGGSQFNSSPVGIDVVVPELSLVKRFAPTAAAANDVVTVELELSNTGTSDARDAVVTDLVDGRVFTDVVPTAPAGWTATTADQDGDTLVTFSADVGTGLAPDAEVELSFTATVVGDVAAPGVANNTAEATASSLEGDDPDERTVDAEDSDSLDLIGVDLVLNKDADVASTEAGEDITYTLTVENLGERDADGVVLTDVLGDHVFFIDASDAHSHEDGTVTWEPFDLAAGDSTTRTVTVRVVDPLPVGAVSTINSADVVDDGSHGDDLNPENNAASATVGLGTVVDLTVDKRGPTEATAGDTITYEVWVANASNRDAEDATVTDTLGDHLVFVSATGGGVYDDDTRTITWSGIDLTGARGESPDVIYEVTVRIDDPVPADTFEVVNDIEVDHPEDVNDINDNDSVTTMLDAEVDLSITKDDGVDQVLPGAALSYSIVVTNNGSRGATGVTVTDTLDENLVFVAAPADPPDSILSLAADSGVYDPDTRTVTWDLGTLEVGETVVLTLQATVASPLTPATTTSITNQVSVVDDGLNGPEADESDNSANDTDLTGADLSVTKDLSSDRLVPGAESTYVIEVSNDGPMTVADLSVEDTLPLGLSLVSASVDRGTIDTETWLWSGVELAPGDTATLTMVLFVDLGVTGEATNTVTVEGVDVGDPTPENNTATTTDPVVPSVDLQLDKQLDGRMVRGQEVDWVLVVTNGGPSRATDVTVVDTLPDGLAYRGATGEGSMWGCNETEPSVVTCVLSGELEPGQEATVRVTTLVSPDAPSGELANSASVDSGQTELVAADNGSVASSVLGSVDRAPSLDETPEAAAPLAFTGSAVGPLAATGLGLSLAGLVLMLIRRRRAA